VISPHLYSFSVASTEALNTNLCTVEALHWQGLCPLQWKTDDESFDCYNLIDFGISKLLEEYPKVMDLE
jgi:hypothetical protein